MKNKKFMSQTEVKIAAAEYFVKHMLDIYYQENTERNEESYETQHMVVLVEKYLQNLRNLESN